MTSDEFKRQVENTEYGVLLAGFPCQTFSRVGLQEGFENEEKGKIFFHISDIIRRTRPFALFLENVDRLVTHNEGRTFKTIIETLVNDLGYYVIGVTKETDGTLKYAPKSFVRNSRDFGVPQNRPRTYIIGFDTERFAPERLAMLPTEMPCTRAGELYHDLNDVLEHDVPPRYYMASGYLETLIKHRERQEGKGYGFGYRIVNAKEIERPIANTLLATGGSGRERNLIYDPKEGIAGQIIKGKKTPLNDKGNPGVAAGGRQERLFAGGHVGDELLRLLHRADVRAAGHLIDVRKADLAQCGAHLFRGGQRTKLSDKGRSHLGDDLVAALDGLDQLEDLGLVGDGAEGAVYQAHAAGDALVRVDLGLAIGVGSNGVHSAGHGAGPLLNDNGLVGAHVGAAAAVDALAGVDVGAAVVAVQLDGVLGADLLAGVGQAALAALGHQHPLLRAAVAGKLNDVDERRGVVGLRPATPS